MIFVVAKSPKFLSLFFGKGGEVSYNRLEEQELSVLALQLLQKSLAFVNTLWFSTWYLENGWMVKFSKAYYRALCSLIYAHVNPYGKFALDMDKNLGLVVSFGFTVFRKSFVLRDSHKILIFRNDL